MTNHTAEPINATLAADWATIWQSEWAAIALDREVLELSQRMAVLWAAQAQAAIARLAADAAAARCTGSDAPARTPAFADALDAGHDGSAA